MHSRPTLIECILDSSDLYLYNTEYLKCFQKSGADNIKVLLASHHYWSFLSNPLTNSELKILKPTLLQCHKLN